MLYPGSSILARQTASPVDLKGFSFGSFPHLHGPEPGRQLEDLQTTLTLPIVFLIPALFLSKGCNRCAGLTTVAGF